MRTKRSSTRRLGRPIKPLKTGEVYRDRMQAASGERDEPDLDQATSLDPGATTKSRQGNVVEVTAEQSVKPLGPKVDRFSSPNDQTGC